jgi:hypothetical protein
MLVGFSAYLAFLIWIYVGEVRAGVISRFPIGKPIVREDNPTAFKLRTAGGIALFAILTGLMIFAWVSFFNGTLK